MKSIVLYSYIYTKITISSIYIVKLTTISKDLMFGRYSDSLLDLIIIYSKRSGRWRESWITTDITSISISSNERDLAQK